MKGVEPLGNLVDLGDAVAVHDEHRVRHVLVQRAVEVGDEVAGPLAHVGDDAGHGVHVPHHHDPLTDGDLLANHSLRHGFLLTAMCRTVINIPHINIIVNMCPTLI